MQERKTAWTWLSFWIDRQAIYPYSNYSEGEILYIWIETWEPREPKREEDISNITDWNMNRSSLQREERRQGQYCHSSIRARGHLRMIVVPDSEAYHLSEFDPLGSSICSEKKRETRKHLWLRLKGTISNRPRSNFESFLGEHDPP